MQSAPRLIGLRTVTLFAASAVVAGIGVGGTQAFRPAAATLSSVHINAGGPAVTESDGSKWQADSGYVGGKVSAVNVVVQGTPKTHVVQTDRYGMSAYRIPVVNGKYDVVLLEAETYFAAVNKRVFSVTAEGRTVAKDVDLFALAGGKNRAYWIKFTTTVADGQLDLGFTASVNYAKVNGISVVPASTTTTPSPSASSSSSPTPQPTASPSASPAPTTPPPTTPPPSASPTPVPSATTSSTSVLWGMDDNAVFDATEAAAGRKFAVVREYRRVDQPYLTAREEKLVTNGHSLVLSVKARTGTGPIPYADITAGKWDSQLVTGMTTLNGLATPTYFIFEHEADATSAKASCTSTTDSVCGPQFVAAWRHIYNLAHAHGLAKLRFTWTITEYGFNPQTGVRNNYYWPGVAYTDWIGIDAYNGGCNDSWYGSFADTMAYGVNWVQAHAPNLPIIIPELGATEGATANAKADFYNAIPAALQQPGYTNIRAILAWNDQESSCDFRVNSSPQAFDAFRAVGLQPAMKAEAAF
jgi:hypothetical protein